MKFFAVLLSTLALAYGVAGFYANSGVVSSGASVAQEYSSAKTVNSYAGGYASDVAYGGAVGAAAVGAAATSAVSETSVTESKSVSASSTNAAVAGSGYGAYGVGGIASGASYGASKVATSTTTYTSKTTTVSQWSYLGKDQYFANVCGLSSNINSIEIVQKLSIAENFDYGSYINSLFIKNALLQNYFYTFFFFFFTSVYEREIFYSLVKSNPAYFFKGILLYAKNPYIFQSIYGRYLISGSSLELLTSYSSYSHIINLYTLFDSPFITSLVRSSFYRSYVAGYFGIPINSYSEIVALQSIYRAFRINPAGTLLLLRHILARKVPVAYTNYLSLNAQIYSSNSFWSRRQFYSKNVYFSAYQSRISYSASSYRSSSTSTATAASAVGGYSSYGY